MFSLLRSKKPGPKTNPVAASAWVTAADLREEGG